LAAFPDGRYCQTTGIARFKKTGANPMLKAIPIAAVLSLAALAPAGATPATTPLASGNAATQLQLPPVEIVKVGYDKKKARRHYRHHHRYARRHYRRHHYRHPPRGWHRYHHRPYGWRNRGCIVIGPLWYCP
jgi:hypothetical protein